MADDKKDLAGQLEIQNEINKVLKQRAAILQNQTKYLSAQTQIAIELCKALECKDLDGMQDRLAEIKKGLEGAAEEAKRLEGGAQSAGEAISGASKNTKKLKKELDPVIGALIGLGKGLKDAFSGGVDAIKDVLNISKEVIGTIGNMTLALLAVPFKSLNLLTQAASESRQQMMGLMNAIESVREEFGGLSQGAGKQVISGFENMKSQMNNVAGAGVNISKAFGPGPEGMQRALEAVSTMMKDLGTNMAVFGSEIEKNSAQLYVYSKGLGLTGEAFKNMATLAQTNGKTLTDQMREVSSQAIQMGNKFGISAKEVASSMAEMAGDVAHFGNMGVKQLSALAVYTKKLGISAKELNSVIDKWDNFESAAEGAAKLSQVFGMNIDAMEMLKEQDPGKRMDMLRQSFQATGKSVQDLSRQELKLLSAQMGLSEEAAKKALMSNLSYDEVLAGSEEAAEKTMSEAESMKYLADTLKQVFGQQDFSSFGDALAKGFQKGLAYSKPFQELFKALNKGMWQIHNAAMELGKMVATSFPGLQKMLGGLKNLLDPTKIKKMTDGVLGAFKQLFKDLETDPKAGIEKFFKRIKKVFTDFFSPSASGGAAKQFMDGLKKFGKTVLSAFANLIPLAVKGAASIIQGIADSIRNPSGLTGAAGDLASMLGDALSTAWEGIKEAWPALKEALWSLWDAIKPALEELWSVISPWIYTYVILKMAWEVATKTLAGAAAAILGEAIKNMFVESAVQGTTDAAPEMQEAAKSNKGLASFAKSISEVIKALAELDTGQIVKAGLKAMLLAVFIGGAMLVLVGAAVLAMWALAKAGIGVGDAIVLFLTVASIVASAGIILAAATLIKPGALEQAIPGLIAIVALVAAMTAVVWIASKALAVLAANKVTEDHVWVLFLTVSTILGGAMLLALAAFAFLALVPDGGFMLAAGLFVVGLVIVAMAMLVETMIDAISVVPIEKLISVSAFLISFSAFLMSTLLILPAMLIFANPVTSVILKSGLKSFSEFALAMVDTVGNAIQKIKKMPIGNIKNVQTIMDMVISLVTAMSEFMASFAAILGSLNPGIIGTVLGGGDNLTKASNATNEVIKSLFEGGIVKIIDKLVGLASSSNINEQSSVAITAIASVISAIGNIMIAMKPDPGVLQAAASGWDDTVDTIKAMTAYTRAAGSQIGELFLIVLGSNLFKSSFLSSLKGVDADSVQLISAIAPIISTIGELAKSLQPDGDVLKDVNSNWFLGPSIEELVTDMIRYMQAMAPAIVQLFNCVGPAISNVITTIVNSLAGLSSKAGEVSKLEPILPILTTALDVLGNILSNVFPFMLEFVKNADTSFFADDLGKQLKDLMTAAASGLSELGTTIGGLVSQIVVLASSIDVGKDLKSFKAKLDSLTQIFDMLGTIKDTFGSPESLKGLSELGAAFAPGGGTDPNLLANALGSIGVLATNTASAIGQLAPISKENLLNSDVISSNIDGLSSALASLTEINAGQINGAYLATTDAVVALAAIRDNYNEIQSILNTIDPIDLSAQINDLGANMAIKSETISVENKPIEITVNLSVTMDANSIATALSNNSNTTVVALTKRNGKPEPNPGLGA